MTVFGGSCSEDIAVICEASAIVNDGARVRTVPCTEDSGILTVLPKRTKITVLGSKKGWYHIQVGLKKGWIADWLVDLDADQFCALSSVSEKLSDESSAEPFEEPPISLNTPEVIFNKAGERKTIIGIDENAYADLVDGNEVLISRLTDQIVLRVHSRGQAYLVQKTGELVSLTGEEVKSYKTGTPFLAPILDSATSSVSAHFSDPFESTDFVLEGELVDPGKVRLTWKADSKAAPYGFKILRSSDPDPVYPGVFFHSRSNATIREDFWSGLKNGKTYYFRACIVSADGGCEQYSSSLSITVSTDGAFASNTLPGSLTLEAAAIGGGRGHFSWKAERMDLSQGLKLLISNSPDPLYPGSAYHRISDPEIRHHLWNGLDIGSIFYFRLCEDLGGFCGIYSNGVSITVQ